MSDSLQRMYAEHDQSPWLDFMDHELIESGRLQALVDHGIRGLTSNPTIFAKAVDAEATLQALAEADTDLDRATAELLDGGLAGLPGLRKRVARDDLRGAVRDGCRVGV